MSEIALYTDRTGQQWPLQSPAFSVGQQVTVVSGAISEFLHQEGKIWAMDKPEVVGKEGGGYEAVPTYQVVFDPPLIRRFDKSSWSYIVIQGKHLREA